MSETLESEVVNNNQPTEKPKLPASIPYIIGNECAERFSFYGMKAVLMVYMTQALLMSKEDASGVIHIFNFAAYLLPFFGALLADLFWGKYKVIFWLSLLYCVGNLILAIPNEAIGLTPKAALFLGLTTIAIGTGGIKSCVSSFVGDQFNASNQSLMSNVYNLFYLSINLGSFFSMMLTPWLMRKFGPHVAFGVPGVLMLVATLIFWLGRNKYSKKTGSSGNFLKELKNPESLKCIGKVLLVYLFLIPFWAMYDQTGSRWVEQATRMNAKLFENCTFLPDCIRNLQILPDQMQAINPTLILILIPVFTFFIYPAISRVFKLTLIRKMQFGLIFATIASLFPWFFECQLIQGVNLNLYWQAIAYFILTIAEVLISVSALELAYCQAPKSMKSFIMSFQTLPIAIGNLLTAGINFYAKGDSSWLGGSNYYLFFGVLLAVDVVGFFLISRNFQEQTILQDDAE